MAAITISAKKRELSTKGYLNQLRKDGYVPGTVYSKDTEAVTVSAPEGLLNKLIYTTKAYLIDLEVEGGETIKCLLHDTQFDPVTDKLIHFDMKRFKEDEVIQIDVPVNLVGNADGVVKGGKLRQAMHKIKVECMPNEVPEVLEFDISHMGLSSSFLVRDIKREGLVVASPANSVIAVVSGSRNAATETEEEEEE